MENYTENLKNSKGTTHNIYFSCGDKDVLHAANKCVAMAINSIDTLLKDINPDNEIVGELKSQLATYSHIREQTVDALQKIDEKDCDVNYFSKFMQKEGIKMNTLADESSSHIAEMMIQGTDMGVIEIHKTLNATREFCSIPAVQLANGLLSTLSTFKNDMIKYL